MTSVSTGNYCTAHIMKFVSSKNKGTPLEDGEMGFSGNSSDLIRAASVKSNDSTRVRSDSMARPAASDVSRGRRHRYSQ